MKAKAYNEAWSFNRHVQRTAKRWAESGIIPADKAAEITGAYPTDYYRPHFFIRVGLFIFTLLGCLTGFALVALFCLPIADDFPAFGLLAGSLACAVLALFALEQFIVSSRLYHAGVDNALLYAGLGALLTALGFFYSEVLDLPVFSEVQPLRPGLLALMLVPVALLLGAAAVRYADALVSAACYFSVLLIVGAAAFPFPLGVLLLPFLLMLASWGCYRLVRRLAQRADYLYYKNCLKLVKALTLATFYLAGNYLAVREANASLNDLPESVQISFAPLFYFFTAAIPLAYLALGLRRPDRIFLHLGLLTAAFSVYTLRHYRSVLPPEMALTLAGTALVLFAAWAMRYLRTARHGLTAAPRKDRDGLNVEALVFAQINQPTVAPTESEFAFGGGQSGGGGATGDY